MILAGADTTATSTASCMRQLAMNPPVQQKLYDLLAAQDFRADSFTDCHYLMAVMYESYRMCPMVWRSLFHVVTEDMTIEGFWSNIFHTLTFFRLQILERWFSGLQSHGCLLFWALLSGMKRSLVYLYKWIYRILTNSSLNDSSTKMASSKRTKTWCPFSLANDLALVKS